MCCLLGILEFGYMSDMICWISHLSNAYIYFQINGTIESSNFELFLAVAQNIGSLVHLKSKNEINMVTAKVL